MEPPTLDAGPVRLRAHVHEDLDGIVEQCADPQTLAWTTVPTPYTREHAEQFLAQTRAKWRTGSGCAFAIADPASDAFLGTIGVTPDGQGQGELGFGLRASARGHGVMSAALRRVADWCFASDGLNLQVLHWRAFVGNWSSRRVVWAVGFAVEGAVRALCVARGERRDAWIGSLRRGDPMRPKHPWHDPPTVHGATCDLRGFSDADIPAVIEAIADPHSRHWLGDIPADFDAAHALAYLHRFRDEAATGRSLYVAAVGPEDRCVGGFGLVGIDTTAQSAEVGYWVHPRARGLGLATEAVRLLVRHATISAADGGLGLRRIALRAAAGNEASQRVATKLGFTRTGVQRRAKLLGDGTYDDLISYDLLADEFDSGAGTPVVSDHGTSNTGRTSNTGGTSNTGS